VRTVPAPGWGGWRPDPAPGRGGPRPDLIATQHDRTALSSSANPLQNPDYVSRTLPAWRRCLTDDDRPCYPRSALSLPPETAQAPVFLGRSRLGRLGYLVRAASDLLVAAGAFGRRLLTVRLVLACHTLTSW
jgi:hypothetical protein